MYATDPISARQLRSAELLVAQEARTHHRIKSRGRAKLRSRRLQASASALRERFLPTRHPVVGVFSGADELFRGLNRSQLESLNTFVEVRSCEVGDSLGRQHETALSFVVVIDAQIGVTIDGLPVTVLDDGSHFGSLPLLDRDLVHRASFDVLEAGLIAIAHPLQFRKMLDQFPTVANRVYAMATCRRRYLEELAACETNQTMSRSTRSMLEYPAHLPV